MNPYEIFKGWDGSRSTNHSILVIMRTTIRIQEFLNGILALPDMTNCMNFAEAAALQRFAVSSVSIL